MTPYGLISKEMKQLLGDNYNQWITNNTLNLNQQRQITLTRVSGENFFNKLISLTPQTEGSVSFTIKIFLLSYYKIMAIERTADTKEFRKYVILILDNKYYIMGMKNLVNDLIVYKRKPSSLQWYQVYGYTPFIQELMKVIQSVIH